MTKHLTLHLFGDQTYDVQPHLKTVLSQRQNPILREYLEKAYNVLRTEIYTLSPVVRDSLPRFTCLDDLLLYNEKGGVCIALDMARTCIYHVATYITTTTAGAQTGHDAHLILGLCTGTLAAAAAKSSNNLIQLIPLAVEATIVAFRIGAHVSAVAQRISPFQDPNAGWSVIIPGSTAAESVQSFNSRSGLPLTSQPYISSHAANGITVTAPSKSMAQFINSPQFAGLQYKSIDTHAPYHAPHLHSEFDVSSIMTGLHHASECVDKKFFAVLKNAISKILLEPIQWTSLVETIQDDVQLTNPDSFSIHSIGTTADQLIYTALNQTSIRALLPKDAFLRPKSKGLASSAGEETTFSSSSTPKLAIIGMSGRFPDAKDNDAFWDVLYKGLDVHKPVPALHWDVKTHVDTTGTKKNTSAAPDGCWLDDPGMFDARFFNISPREAPQIDPAQRLALMTAYEAIEQAGIVPDATPSTRRDRVGVFYGVTSNDWMETNSAQDIDTYFIPGGNRAFIPGRINYCFKFSGPSYAVDTACSSSLAGIHLACNSLWRGDIDTAIAGGTNVLTNPDFTAGLDRGHFLSRSGNCKTFDDAADGYCRGEGIGTVIIKRLDDAIADNDPILATILGAYTNHSAESESITRPHVGAQRAIFSKILNQGGIDPYSVSYVEMHGTGTQAGDAGEMSSVLDTFAPALDKVSKGRTDDQALYLGSAKANIGHGEAASGVSSLIKVLMMLQKNMIVPHCGIKTRINRKFPTDLEARKVKIALKPTQWPRSTDPAKPRRIFVNNFSAAGGNSALLLEDSPDVADNSDVGPDIRTSHPIAISAKNATSIQGNIKSMIRFLKENPDIPLSHIAYTTTARRVHHPHRVMAVGGSHAAVITQLEEALRDNLGTTRRKSVAKVVFTFTGQGAQYPGMGKDLFDSFSVFHDEMCRLDQLVKALGFDSMLPVIMSDSPDISTFTPTTVQLANVCMQISLVKLWASWGIHPSAVIGHSLGEYAALNTAGVLSEADTIYLVGHRATLLEKKCTKDTHAMLVIKGSVDDVKAALVGYQFEVACLNSPVETVLAGPIERITNIKTSLTEQKIKSTVLKVPFAFHSSQVEPILAELETIASSVTFSSPAIPVICPLDGKVAEGPERFSPGYLSSHARQTVNMQAALLEAKEKGYLIDHNAVLEIGPHPAISSMIKAVLGSQMTCLMSAQRGRDTWQVLGSTLKSLYTAGVDVRWPEFHRDFKASAKVVALPAYSWDLKHYWMQYVNDWSLRKGDPAPMSAGYSKLESTTIHRIVDESVDTATGGKIVVEADIVRKDLSPLVQGHEVNGIPLCTPSVYADIALTLGTYLANKYRPADPEKTVDVSSMDISKALILREDAPQQLLQAHGDVEWETKSIALRFMSFDSKGKLQEHARCVVRLCDGTARQKQLQAKAKEVKDRMARLRSGVSDFSTARFNRAMVYRAIRPLARFHDDYRAIDEIILNSNTLEASTKLSFGTVKRGGSFHTHPAIIDSLTQGCGFTMNCNDSTDLDKEVFMNHGWGSFQIFQDLDFDKTYTTYTQMKQGEDKLWHGDSTVFDGDTIVAHFGQIAIQGVPRRVLGVILSIEAGSKSKAKTKQPAVIASAEPPSSVVATSKTSTVPVMEAEMWKACRFDDALAIIAEESGLAVADLTDNTHFGDVGIDSLLGLTITARFKEELDLDMDFNALFYEYPTVQDLRSLFGSVSASSSSSSTSGEEPTGASSPVSAATVVTAPVSESGGDKVDFQQALSIISEESGVSMDELTDDTNFADAGVDSLLTLVIVSRFRDELDIDIQHESLLLECPTVADLRVCLTGVDAEPTFIAVPEMQLAESGNRETISVATAEDAAALAARKNTVLSYINKYAAGFKSPSFDNTGIEPKETEKVVLVTGASGSLGGNLVYHLAHLPDVKTVICLNRTNKAEPYTRQYKAMRDKGLRFPEALRSKLVVYQTDTSLPQFGLEDVQYRAVVESVTHLVHNAWPMSAKRPISGFESQFQVMRNLIDLGSQAASLRPESWRFSFQMVSSIGVVGNYGLENGKVRTMVPEERVDIDCVLPNGYSDAKWGCERMMDMLLHPHASRFRAMTVRLGQIAGSRTSGYWNPMEHFGFLVKSSQTLNALPDAPGKVYWTSVNDIAATLSDLVLSTVEPHLVYHIENPIGQQWSDMNAVLSDALQIPNLIPFGDWVTKVREAPQRDNPAYTLLEFLDSNYLRMSCGGLVLDVKNTLEHSATLRGVGPIPDDVARKYIHVWKEIGFLRS